MGRKLLRSTALQSRDAIELLADKWRIALLHLLRSGALRNRELQSALQEVSPKMLTQTLRGMERDGLIARTVFAAAPPRVEYQLTKMGRSVIKPIRQLCLWAERHVRERDAARARFDLNGKPSRRGDRASSSSSRRQSLTWK